MLTEPKSLLPWPLCQEAPSPYPRLFHLLDGELEQVGQLLDGEHRHGFALGLNALCDRDLLQAKPHTSG